MRAHRPRDRSHYERFSFWHRTFYGEVEATSVTPYGPRAVDRGLAAVTVALVRHGDGAMTAPLHVVRLAARLAALGRVADVLAARAPRHGADLTGAECEELRQKLKRRVNDLLDIWSAHAHEQQEHGAGLQYAGEAGGEPPLLVEPMAPTLATLPVTRRRSKAGRSLRDVEPNVNLWVQSPDGHALEMGDEAVREVVDEVWTGDLSGVEDLDELRRLRRKGKPKLPAALGDLGDEDLRTQFEALVQSGARAGGPSGCPPSPCAGSRHPPLPRCLGAFRFLFLPGHRLRGGAD